MHARIDHARQLPIMYQYYKIAPLYVKENVSFNIENIEVWKLISQIKFT